MHCQTAFFLKKNAACRIYSGYIYSDFALNARCRLRKKRNDAPLKRRSLRKHY